ncbi:TPA: type II toxin-antitoxin system VapC family toxin [bacterium]|nr:type II toxin-antitoxin system VapC family toxin [bacterium]
MSLQKSLLDTDILSAIMRKHPLAILKAKKYLSIYRQFSFSIITQYEILRGLKTKGLDNQISSFERLCKSSSIVPLTNEVVIQASRIYADLYQRGLLISDADILIAASAIANGYTLVTNNTKHFERISGLNIENWLKIE